MLIAVLSGFVLAIIAPQLHRVGRQYTGWILSLLPLGIFAYLASFIPRVTAGEVIIQSQPWIPSLGINFSFYLDGLSLIFGMLVSGIGFLVVAYGSGYLAGDKDLGRFYLYILAFMAAMLGLVLSDNLLTFFIFWELTGITSYLLIGYKHSYADSRDAALQAFLVTLAGGLALMAGVILLGFIGGTWEFSALIAQADAIRAHALYPAIVALMLLGAFTKSAQFPFHFWLPNAMAAPTPVSSYLHSATMVKAGVYLVARYTPVLGGTDLWFNVVAITGAITMVLGAYIAWQKSDLKQILAYTTISALGTLVMLIGIGTSTAMKAAMVFLVVHACYKGALFMAAGAIDHEAGTREIDELGGLRKAMPITAIATGLAALSMAGLPPFFGFVGKELIYETTLAAPSLIIFLTVLTVITKVLTMVAAGKVAILPFFGPPKETPKHAHEAPPSMWLGPVVLSGSGLVLGLAPALLAQPLVNAAVDNILLKDAVVKLYLIPSEISGKVILSLLTIVLGVVTYLIWPRLARLLTPSTEAVSRYGPEQWYWWSLDGLVKLAKGQTKFLQNGYLRYYVLTTVVASVGVLGYTMFSRVLVSLPTSYTGVRIHEGVVALLIALGALLAVTTRSRLTAVAGLGVVGYGVALIYILFNAPDLAMTQLAIETLTVILLVLVLYRLPRFEALTARAARARDAIVAAGSGVIMTLLVLVISAEQTDSLLTPFFAENSWPLAKGRNVVNVILVDFRALDTLGEITVLAIAAVGVIALLKLRPSSLSTDASSPLSSGDKINIDEDIIRS